LEGRGVDLVLSQLSSRHWEKRQTKQRPDQVDVWKGKKHMNIEKVMLSESLSNLNFQLGSDRRELYSRLMELAKLCLHILIK